MADDTDENGQVHSEQANAQGSPKVAGDSISVGVGEAAKNVAAGKNIIQIGSLSIPRWAAITATAMLVLLLIVIALVGPRLVQLAQQNADNTGQLVLAQSYTPTPTPTLTAVPTPTSTPLPFAPAKDGETLIVIAPFQGEEAKNALPHEEIRDAIQHKIDELSETSIRVEIDPDAAITTDKRYQEDDARALGERYNASMVIWGQDKDVRVAVDFLNLHEPDFEAADVSIDETQKTKLANPSAYSEFITRDLPGQMTFLTLFAVGSSFYGNSQYAPAIRYITAAVESVGTLSNTVPGLSDAYFTLGWLHQAQTEGASLAIAQGDGQGLDRAIADYTKAVTLDPHNAAAYNNRGTAYSAKGDLAQAIADYSQAITLDPQYAFAFNNRASAYHAKGEFDQAIADYNQAIILDPQNADSHNNRGLAYSDWGNLDQAIADYNQAITLDPENADAYYGRGNVYSAKGDLDKAIADYSRAITLGPEKADAYYGRGNAYRARGDLDRAIADYSQAITLDSQAAAAYNNRGMAYHAKGDLDRAIADYKQAISIDPKLAAAYNNRGNAYINNGDLDKAIADYSQAIALDPQVAAVYNNRGMAYYVKGDLDKAIADYSRAITRDPLAAAAYNNRGNAYRDKGELDQAIADYNQAITRDPQYAGAFNNRGNAYRDKGEPDQAIADYNQTIILDPNFAEAYNNLCLTLALQQKPELAIAYCEKAVSLENEPNYGESRGLAHALLGESHSAADDFQVYVDWLAENYPDKTQLIDQLKLWIEQLRRGENPFTPDVLEGLKNQ